MDVSTSDAAIEDLRRSFENEMTVS